MLKSGQTKSFTVEDVDDDLTTCGICHNEIDDARSLVCLHTYCLECLREWSIRKSEKTQRWGIREVKCPICREPTSLNQNGVDGLRRNFFVNKLKDRKSVRHQVMNKDVEIACTSCDVSDGNEAVARCLECDDFLCHGCFKAHKSLRLTKNHTMLTLVELRSGKSIIVKQSKQDHCQDHPGQVMWFYCKSCDTPICRDCTVINHPTHKHELIRIDVAAADQKFEIKRLLRLCKVKKEEVDEAFKKISRVRHSLESTRNTVNNAIDEKKEKVKQSLIQSLEKQAAAMKSRVSEMMYAREKAASTHEEELQILNSRLTTALDVASQMTSDGSDYDVASVYKHLTTTLRQLRQESTPATPAIDLGDVRFVEDVSLTTSIGSIGSIHESKPPRIHCMQRPEVGHSHMEPNRKSRNASWKMIREFGESSRVQLHKLNDPNGVAINQNGNVVVADGDRVKIFANSGRFMTSFIETTHTLQYSPLGPGYVAMYQGNYIVNNMKGYITVYDKSGKHIRQMPLKRKSRGLAVDSQGYLLVGNYYEIIRSKHTNALDIYRFRDGKHVKSLDIPFSIRHITVSNSTDDRIVISNYRVNACRVIDSQGQTIHKLCPYSDFKSSWYPTGVTTIGKGDGEEVFVCNNLWRACKVYRFALNTGKYLGCVTSDVSNPRGITFTADGKLVVVNAEPACIKLFTPSTVHSSY